jgi:hypothetical protein
MFTIIPIMVSLTLVQPKRRLQQNTYSAGQQRFTGLKYSNQIFQDEADHSSSFFLLAFFLTQSKLNTQLFQTTSIRQRCIVHNIASVLFPLQHSNQRQYADAQVGSTVFDDRTFEALAIVLALLVFGPYQSVVLQGIRP